MKSLLDCETIMPKLTSRVSSSRPNSPRTERVLSRSRSLGAWRRRCRVRRETYGLEEASETVMEDKAGGSFV